MQFMHAAFFFFLGEKYEYKTYLPKVKKSGDFGCVFQRTKGTISQTCLHGTKNFLALDMFSENQRFLDMFAKYQGFLDLGYIFKGPKVRDLRNICRRPRIFMGFGHVCRGPRISGLYTYFQRTKCSGSWTCLQRTKFLQTLDRKGSKALDVGHVSRGPRISGFLDMFAKDQRFQIFEHVCRGPRIYGLWTCLRRTKGSRSFTCLQRTKDF